MTELEYLRRQHQDGRVSRRDFPGRAAALGASAALVSTMLGRIEAHAAAAPRNGGALRLGLGSGSIDPTSYNDSVMIDASRALFNGLVEWGQYGKPVPELAESWEARPGATEWMLNLKKGVTFSNGKTFGADDAIYSINLHRGQNTSVAAGAFEAIKGAKKLTDRSMYPARRRRDRRAGVPRLGRSAQQERRRPHPARRLRHG
jgi:peptide/nickel transport system substrate-binding protein